MNKKITLPRAARALALVALLSSTLAFPAFAAPKGGHGGGDPAEPTDVNVINTPKVEVGNVVYVVPLEAREPVHVQYQLSGTGLSNSLSQGRYQVPAGKRLTITFVSAGAYSPSGVLIETISLSATSDQGAARAQHRLMVPPAILNSSNLHVASLSQPMHLVVNPGEWVGLWYGRTSAPVGSPPAIVHLNFSGYLEDV
jgi:hypothetical protein